MAFPNKLTMNLKPYIKFCLFLASAIIVGSCTKNIAGPKGDPGTPGGSGNLKETLIPTFVRDSSTWTFDNYFWTNEIFILEITKNVIENGEVRVFINDGVEWHPLPHAVGNIFTQMSVKEGFLELTRKKIHDGPPARPENMKIRVTIFSPVQ
jgi:hypothetical protein